MKHKKINRDGVLEEGGAEEILKELYKIGHGLADRIAECALGDESGREEREDIIRHVFLLLAGDVETLEQMSMEERLRYMGMRVWDSATRRKNK